MIDLDSHLDLYPDGLALALEVTDRNQFTLVVTASPCAYYATSRVFAGLRIVKVALSLHPEIAHSKADELDALVGGRHWRAFLGEVGWDRSSGFRRILAVQEHFPGNARRVRETEREDS